ncbi:MFS transporter [Paenibacillus doosanensis]|uniref:Drug efflux system protein MdtG n=1 Tax=Paenibacillus konkukensis TaxID=2020716 RepID=A0ABY4RVK0_9BACL|nr:MULTISPECIES: MFS transporter [Paenibacillus]MCS7464221.1 MFS transporter [Paenibacillus doosanensis]UQZ85588.1 drug efflux system protein MdtG [Paenibacillus konkukensis]
MNMEKAVRAVGIYGGGIFFGVMSVAQPFFTLYAEALGASTALIGLIVTLRALVPMFIAMPIGQMIDTMGPMKMTKIGCLMLIVSLGLMSFSTTLAFLAVSQVLLGTSMIIMASSLQVLASDGEQDKARRNKNINRFSMWNSAGNMVGPLLGGLVVTQAGSSLWSYRSAFVASLVVCSVCFILILLIRTPDGAAKRGATKELFQPKEMLNSYVSGIHLTRHRGVQFGLVGTFLIMFIQALYASFIPLYLNGHGYSAFVISSVISLMGLSGFVSRFLLGRLMKLATLEKILIVAGCIASVCLILIPVASLHLIGIAVLTFLLGSSIGMNLPITIMIMVEETKDNERGKVMGLRLLTNRLSQMVAPAMFGLLGQALGLTAAFYTGGGVLLATMLGFAVYSSHRAPAADSGEAPAAAGESSGSG